MSTFTILFGDLNALALAVFGHRHRNPWPLQAFFSLRSWPVHAALPLAPAYQGLGSERGWRRSSITIAAIFVVAVVLNYPWELAQSGLHATVPLLAERLRHCFVASLGDGVLVLAIHAAGSSAFGDFSWFANPRGTSWLMMIGSVLIVAIVVEWAAVSVGRWSYGADMPILSGLSVALPAVTQMVVLPSVVFALISWVR